MRPRGHRHCEPLAVSFQTEIEQPGRLPFLGGDSADDVLVQSLADDVRLHICGEAVLVLTRCDLFYDFILCHSIEKPP